MNVDIGKVAKRFGKVFLASGAGYGACYALTDIQLNPWAFLFAPIISAGIAAIGNFIKHKFGIKLPF